MFSKVMKSKKSTPSSIENSNDSINCAKNYQKLLSSLIIYKDNKINIDGKWGLKSG